MTAVADAFFAELLRATQEWSRETAKVLTDPSCPEEMGPHQESVRVRGRLTRSDAPDIEAVLFSALTGLAHSILVILDGGSPLADYCDIRLVTESGEPLGDALHEGYFAFLAEHGIPMS